MKKVFVLFVALFQILTATLMLGEQHNIMAVMLFVWALLDLIIFILEGDLIYWRHELQKQKDIYNILTNQSKKK